MVHRSVRCPSVTFAHTHAKAVGRNEMPFGRDTRMLPSNTLLDRGRSPPWEVEIWGSEPPVLSDVAYRRITVALVVRESDMHRPRDHVQSQATLPRRNCK